ncbi:MAG: hypothetical protein Q8O89_08190 [Nanoarchaeota archaeon]|nr:hypothetical protein [Nanoarchaeota archaeon]
MDEYQGNNIVFYSLKNPCKKAKEFALIAVDPTANLDSRVISLSPEIDITYRNHVNNPGQTLTYYSVQVNGPKTNSFMLELNSQGDLNLYKKAKSPIEIDQVKKEKIKQVAETIGDDSLMQILAQQYAIQIESYQTKK